MTNLLPAPHEAMMLRGRLSNAARIGSLSVLLLAACGGGGGDSSEGVTYGNDIQPIFNRRCTTCHRPGGPSGVDIRNPFSSEPPPNVGLARAQTQWKVRDPELAIPELDVKAGDPSDSFLIYKISDPSSGLLPIDPDGTNGPELPPAGSHMPLQVPVLSTDEVKLIEDWVFAGAPNGDFMDRGDRLDPPIRPPQMRNFAADVQPIFGVEEKVNEQHGVCLPGGGPCAHCIYCHYQGTLNPPNLSDPFGPDGIVDVRATLRPDLTVEQFGPRMPYSYAVLSPDQVDLVRQWIQEGARP